jgi:two-component system phosphate regulon response regulator PhoB
MSPAAPRKRPARPGQPPKEPAQAGAAILFADDEPDVVDLVSMHLRNAGYRVFAAASGEEAIAVARSRQPALAVLDIMMPGMSGFEVCKAIRTDPATVSLPIILLTSRVDEVDRVVGFELGADDYITKPFSPRELILRIRAVLRRAAPPRPTQQQVTLGDIEFDPAAHEVRVQGKPVDLTPTEFRLLKTLVQRRGRVQSREHLLVEVWGYDNSSIDTRTVDTHMRRLREKLGPASVCIETVRGFGYRLTGPE